MTTSPLQEERRWPTPSSTVLAEAGVEFVLGMPGGYTGPIFSGLHGHPTIRTIQVREESIGSTMAEAYGRLTGRPLVVMGQGEWIAGNAGQGFLEALLGSSPLVILTEMSDGAALSHHAPYQSGTGDYGTWDARQCVGGRDQAGDGRATTRRRPCSTPSWRSSTPSPVSPVRSPSSSTAVRCGAGSGPASVPRIYPTAAYLPRPSSAVDDGQLGGGGEARCAAAARPVIIAGNGVRVGQACGRAGRRWPARSTPPSPRRRAARASSTRPTRSPPASWAASAGRAPTRSWAGPTSCWPSGTKLGPHDTADENVDLLDPSRQTMIQIDVEPLNAGWTFPVDHVLVGDAGAVMDRLTAACASATRSRPPTRRRTGCARRSTATASSTPREFRDDAVPFAPQRIICDPARDVPRRRHHHLRRRREPALHDALVPLEDPGPVPPAGRRAGAWATPYPRRWRPSWPIPDRPALAVCGDGGFAMSIHALMTAVQEHLPIGVLVFNNGALGWVLHGMGERAVAACVRPVRPCRHRPLARLRRRPRRERERAARRHQIVPRCGPAVRHRRADVAHHVVPRGHPGHRPPAPRDRLLTDQYAATTRRHRSASRG